MISLYLSIGGAILASLLSLLFATLMYSLREFSRPRFAELLGKRNADKWFDPVTEHTADLVYLCALARQFCNILVWITVFATFEQLQNGWLRYAETVIVAGVIAVFCSITIPHAAARYSASEIVAIFSPLLYVFRLIFSPLTRLMHGTDNVVKKALGAKDDGQESQIEEDILTAIEEGEKEGIVDEQEREIIESAIEFGDTTTAQIMTTRHDMASIPVEANLEEAKQMILENGHSRIPVYEGTLDHVVGILYARDLIKQIGLPVDAFSMRSFMRPPIFVPETKTLGDLLRDFRLQKVHIAIVLDEYGGTAGLVTIEDVLEELVGEISDEHEPAEPAMLKKIDDKTFDADARISIEELNRAIGLGLPEDAGYETLGGFLITSLAGIPEKGAVYEHAGARYTVLDAEPQRVKRVKIELVPVPEVAGKQ
jgi:putative hemolysin